MVFCIFASERKYNHNKISQMTISLILTTYNNIPFLNLCLKSISELNFMPMEVIVADDGSTDDTKKLINSYKKKISVPVHHLWHEDIGFRLSEIRNKGIALAKGEYVICIDGDLILNPYFVFDHAKMSRPKTLLQGTRGMLSENVTKRLIDDNNVEIKLFSGDIKGAFKTIRAPKLSPLFNLIVRNKYSRSYAKGANMSYYKEDALAVNGYDQDFMGWGHEDADFNLRMMNNGIKRKFLKQCAVAYHLHHEGSHRIDDNPNMVLLRQHEAKNSIWCKNGIIEMKNNDESK